MKHKLIGLQQISNNELIVLSEKVIKTISLKRIEKVREWANDLVDKLNGMSRLKRWWIGAENKTYTIEDVMSFQLESFDLDLRRDFDLWEKQYSENWADDLMSIAQHVYRSTKQNSKGKTYIELEHYSRLLRFIKKYCV